MRPRVHYLKIEGLTLFLFSFLLAACGPSLKEPRETRRVENVPVDSLRFHPTGMRYLQTGQEAVVHLRGMQGGFACARFTRVDLESSNIPSGQVVDARVDVELPAYPDCPVSAGRDSLVSFPAGGDNNRYLMLRNTLLAITDAVRYVDLPEKIRQYHFKPNTQGNDTIVTEAGGNMTADTLVYGLLLGHPQISLPLSVCDSVNYAQIRNRSDTISVTVSIVSFAGEAVFPAMCLERSARQVLAYPARD